VLLGIYFVALAVGVLVQIPDYCQLDACNVATVIAMPRTAMSPSAIAHAWEAAAQSQITLQGSEGSIGIFGRWTGSMHGRYAPNPWGRRIRMPWHC